MARIYPFRAWRYNPAAVRLEDVVTQPRDRISPALQQAYYQRSPYNLVRVILGLPELFDAEKGESVYTRAARDFKAWRERGILIQEREPAVFAYTQCFTVPGDTRRRERRGFIALGRLYEYSEQIVFRHEQTPANPTSDRLSLLRATRAHFEQIFMLYSDPARSVDKLLFEAGGPADAEISDDFGVLHRLWRINDAATLRLLTSAMEDKKLIIADGHRRYETALHYGREYGAEFAARNGPGTAGNVEYRSGQLPQPAYPESAIMMTFVNMDAEGLEILPIHRAVHGLAHFDAREFARAAGRFFVVQELPSADAAGCLEILKAQKGTAFVAVTGHGALLLKAKPEAVAAELAEIPERRRRLDSTQLHALLLERIPGLDAAKIEEETNLRSLRDAGEGIDQVRRGDADLVLLTNPVTMSQLREVAFAGELMPRKSTDFYPKLLSGLAIYALE